MSQQEASKQRGSNSSPVAVVPHAAQLAALETIFSHLGLLFFTAGPDGRLAGVNAACERVLGYSQPECIDRTFWELLDGGGQTAARASFRRLAAGEPLVELVGKHRAKDGSVRWVVWTMAPAAQQGVLYGIGREIIPEDFNAEGWAGKDRIGQAQPTDDLIETYRRERRLIGFEIHDGLVQLLAGAVMHLEDLRPMVCGDERARKSFEQSRRLLGQSLQEARRLIHDLVPMGVAENGLVAALEGLIHELRQQTAISIEFHAPTSLRKMPEPLASTIYRVVQESLNNACRHSRSDSVRVVLAPRGTRLAITVEDWGIGFDPDAVPADRYGLRGLRERARTFGGEVILRSRRGWGTKVSIEFPLPAEREESAILPDEVVLPGPSCASS